MTGVPVLTIWRRYGCILPFKAGMIFTLQMFSTYYPVPMDGKIHAELVLATGPGDQPVVRVWTAKMGLFGSRPAQQSDPRTLDRPNLDLYPSISGFHLLWLDLSDPMSGSVFRVSNLWSHSDILLWIVQYWYWYVTVYFWCIGRLNELNKMTHAPYYIEKMGVNGGFMIFGLASSVIWVVLDHKDPYTRIWQPL